jgi:hypothetical protein
VHELDGHRRAQRRVAPGRVGTGGDEHEQRAQALAAGRDRRARVLAEHVAVRAHDRREALLERPHQLRDVGAAGFDDRGDRLSARHRRSRGGSR